MGKSRIQKFAYPCSMPCTAWTHSLAHFDSEQVGRRCCCQMSCRDADGSRNHCSLNALAAMHINAEWSRVQCAPTNTHTHFRCKRFVTQRHFSPNITNIHSIRLEYMHGTGELIRLHFPWHLPKTVRSAVMFNISSKVMADRHFHSAVARSWFDCCTQNLYRRWHSCSRSGCRSKSASSLFHPFRYAKPHGATGNQSSADSFV